MKEVHLISVGKIKDQSMLQLEHEYYKRITFPQVVLTEIKSADTKEQESAEVLKKINDIGKGKPHFIVLLTEQGKSFDSLQFSKWFYSLIEEKMEKIFFVINGAEGPSQELKKVANFQLSLSPLTFAHQLARILLLEQFFRAQTIHQNHPYHK